MTPKSPVAGDTLTVPNVAIPFSKHSETCLRFSPYAWAKLQFLCHSIPTEVGAMGITAAGDPLLVMDMYLPKQVVNEASNKFDDDDLDDMMFALSEQGHNPINVSRVWIHTHPGNSAAPSSTDWNTFEATFSKYNWAIMFILAEGGETSCWYNSKGDPEKRLPGFSGFIDVDVDWHLSFEGSDVNKWKAEIEEKVRRQVIVARRETYSAKGLPAPTKPVSTYRSGGRGGYAYDYLDSEYGFDNLYEGNYYDPLALADETRGDRFLGSAGGTKSQLTVDRRQVSDLIIQRSSLFYRLDDELAVSLLLGAPLLFEDIKGDQLLENELSLVGFAIHPEPDEKGNALFTFTDSDNVVHILRSDQLLSLDHIDMMDMSDEKVVAELGKAEENAALLCEGREVGKYNEDMHGEFIDYLYPWYTMDGQTLLLSSEEVDGMESIRAGLSTFDEAFNEDMDDDDEDTSTPEITPAQFDVLSEVFAACVKLRDNVVAAGDTMQVLEDTWEEYYHTLIVPEQLLAHTVVCDAIREKGYDPEKVDLGDLVKEMIK